MSRHRWVMGCLASAVVLAVGGSSRAVAATRPDVPPAVTVAAPGDIDPYLAAMGQAHRDGLTVWVEADLVKRWRAGPEAFRQGIDVIAREAAVPGVAGVKIADELGYNDGLESAPQVTAFLDASAAALRSAAPRARILVDMVVPALGCMPGRPDIAASTVCAVAADRAYPQLSLAAVDGYLARHDVDVLDLSTGLLDAATYAAWGSSLDDAQVAAWTEVTGRGWDRLVTLQARKALAHPGTDPDSTAAAEAVLGTFVDTPLRYGAGAVDVWTWRQRYRGDVYRLADPGLRGNALWTGLVDRHGAGVRLFTHFSPNSVEVGVAADLRMLATAFTDVFVAAGTG